MKFLFNRILRISRYYQNPLFLLFIASILFALSFPSSLLWSAIPDPSHVLFPVISSLSHILEQGLPILIFLFALPLLQVLQQLNSLRQALLYGAFYGFNSYLLLSLWLFDYDWIAFILIPGIYLYYFSIFFAANFLIKKIFTKHHLPYDLNYLIFIISWMLLEYSKSTGWVAYTYGNLLYSHYLFPNSMYFSRNFLLQNFAYLIILTPAICLHRLLRLRYIKNKTALFISVLIISIVIAILRFNFFANLTQLSKPGAHEVHTKLLAEKMDSTPIPVNRDKLNIALLQHNINSWQTEENTNRQALERLLKLSYQAEQANAELIVWSETAFVPIYRSERNTPIAPILESIQNLEQQPNADNLHYFRSRYEEAILSHRLQDYLNQAKATYLIGTNDYGQPDIFPGEKKWGIYNTILLIQKGQILGTYHKRRLVPFTEEAKWEKLLPGLNKLLQRNGFAQYSTGKSTPILTVPLENKLRPNLKIYTMICYEDSLPLYWPHYLLAPKELRQAINKQNFDILLSVSNDSWSPSPIGGLQHLSSSISRAVEMQRYFLRGTTSGQTTVIGPQGQIIERLEANTPGILYFRLPL